MIDRLGLYDTVCTDPRQKVPSRVEHKDWHKAYDLLYKVLNEPENPSIKVLRSILTSTSDDVYHSWLLCTVVPWVPPIQGAETCDDFTSVAKAPLPLAVIVAREGLKIENKSMSIIKNAVLQIKSISLSIDTSLENVTIPSTGGKRRPESSDREDLGMRIREWGTCWRNSTMLAMLVEAMHVSGGSGKIRVRRVTEPFSLLIGPEEEKLIAKYSTWLLKLKQLDVLEAYTMRPLVDGHSITNAVGRKGGPWTKEAIEMIIRWQLRNPGEADAAAALAEVVARFRPDFQG